MVGGAPDRFRYQFRYGFMEISSLRPLPIALRSSGGRISFRHQGRGHHLPLRRGSEPVLNKTMDSCGRLMSPCLLHERFSVLTL